MNENLLKQIEENEKYSKVGGWLVLFTLILLYTIFRTFLVSISNLGLIKDVGFNNLFTILTQSNQIVVFTGILEFIGNLIVFIISIIVVIFYFRYRKVAPKLVIIFVSLYAILNIILYFLYKTSIVTSITSKDILSFGIDNHYLYLAITHVIWIPYFLLSYRVKKTFVK